MGTPMNNKPNARNWSDVQLAIVSIAMALTLVLWNVFAGPDRAKTENQTNPPVAQSDSTLPGGAPMEVLTPTPLPQVVILLGTSTPPPPASVPGSGGGNNGGNRGGGGGGGGGGTGGS